MTFLLSILTWIVNWARKNKTAAILSGIVAVLIFVLLFQTYCGGGKSKPELDEKLNQEVHEAIESKERKKMEEVFVKVEAKQAEIESSVSNAKANTVNAIAEAKKKVSEMTDAELAAYLESLN
jgi:hypothetical protein